MNKMEFSISLPSPADDMFKLALDFEKLPTYLPDQLKEVRILEKKNDEIITEEKILFSSIFKKTILQKTAHKIISDSEIISTIKGGPAKGTIIHTNYVNNGSGTTVTIMIELKLSLSYRILKSKIEKFYKIFLTGILYKMNNELMENQVE